MSKPLEVRLLEGGDTTNTLPKPLNFGKGGNFPDAPDILNEIGREQWHRTGGLLWQLEVLHLTDLDTLFAYCRSYELWYHMQSKIDDADPNQKASYHNPTISMIRQELLTWQRLGRDLGLTPTSRGKLAFFDVASGNDAKALKAQKYVDESSQRIRYTMRQNRRKKK